MARGIGGRWRLGLALELRASLTAEVSNGIPAAGRDVLLLPPGRRIATGHQG